MPARATISSSRCRAFFAELLVADTDTFVEEHDLAFDRGCDRDDSISASVLQRSGYAACVRISLTAS